MLQVSTQAVQRESGGFSGERPVLFRVEFSGVVDLIDFQKEAPTNMTT